MDTNKFLATRRKAQAEQQARQENKGSLIPFLKLPQGNHQIRFLPKGNKQEKLPFKSVLNHTFKLKADGGSTIFVYALCYKWLFSHENAKEATLQPLRSMGKLTDQDIQAYKKFGCPVCNARDVLLKGGESKEVWQQCNVRGANYWNVLLRSDQKVYVWSISDTNHDIITGDMEMYLALDEKTGQPGEDAVDIMHPVTGHDYIVKAVGEKNNRRYYPKIKPKACPIGEMLEGEKPLDLMVVVAESYKSYGEMCQLLRRMEGRLLASYGFDYGIVMPEDRKKDNEVDDDFDDDDEDSNDLKAKKANVKTNPSSIEWDDDDEENPKPKKASSVGGQKSSKKPVDLEDDDDEEEDEPTPPKKSATKSGSSSPNKAGVKGGVKEVAPWDEDDDEEDTEDDDADDDDEAEFDGGHIVNKKTGKRLF